jgi:hypothetical protein
VLNLKNIKRGLEMYYSSKKFDPNEFENMDSTDYDRVFQLSLFGNIHYG